MFFNYEHFYFVIETSIAFKILFIYIFLSQILVDAAAGYGLPPSQGFFIFTLGIQTFVLP